MSGIFDQISPETAIKWGVTILITGFIAQFGKRFATYIIEKVKAFKKPGTGDGNADTDLNTANKPLTSSNYYKVDAKAEKKRAKALAKLHKKTSGSPDRHE